ncbi:immunity 8 family protein [Patulibacter medicamentivorans]|uniref:immunity 8 family protein n=1 Tax=Patulibacter medicamentivorans TaxID=1097667 RepID=UPI00058CC14E|nr:immunity 8 family protein [Patulibacter medicamentivorans]
MKAVIRSLMSVDVDDLPSWAPEDDRWSLGLRILAGPDDGPGEESFDLTVCSLSWMTDQVRKDGVFAGRHHLIVEWYDWPLIEAHVRRRVATCEGADWAEVAAKIGRFAYWEFEDYVE